MAAKDVKFSGDARDRMLRGVDILANAAREVKGNWLWFSFRLLWFVLRDQAVAAAISKAGMLVVS